MRVNRHGQRRRRHPGIAGRIGCRRRKAMSSIGQGARGKLQAPLPFATALPKQRRAVIDLDR